MMSLLASLLCHPYRRPPARAIIGSASSPAQVHVARVPVDELGFRLIVIADEVEQRIEHFEVPHRHAAPA